MGILDKLRLQPKIKHSDPTVRLEGIHDIDPAEQDVLVALAKDDGDARVRRAAVARVDAAAALADIARNEADDGVREAAVARLAEQAARHDEAVASPAVTALAGLGRERELATVARS